MSLTRSFRTVLYSAIVVGLIITGSLQNVSAQQAKKGLKQIEPAKQWQINYVLTAKEKKAFASSPKMWTRQFLEERGHQVNDVFFVGVKPISAATCFSSSTDDPDPPTTTHLDPCTWVIV